ncbi:MAG: ABC transporter ATP-binding protein [Anaerolineae bacterium]|nr:ABC transporter ATP-binding protein [Anaerolineae bacterium]
MMHGGPMRRLAEAGEEKPRNTREVIMRLAGYLLPHKWALVGVLFFVLISAASQGLGPILTGRAVDELIANKDTTGLAITMVILIAVYLVGWLGTRYQIYLMGKLSQEILAGLRQQVFDKLQSLSLQYLEGKLAGDLMSRLVNDIQALDSFFSQAFVQMVGSVFALLGILIAMMALNWQLGLAVLVVLPVLWFVTTFFSRLARNAFKKTRETIGDVSADLEEELSGVKVAQAFNRTDVNVRRFAQRNAANRDANINATAVTSAFSPAMDVLSTLDTALVAAMGGALAIRGDISVGVVVAFLQYVQNFFRPLQTVAQMWTLAQAAFAAAERIFDILDQTPGVADAPDAKQVSSLEGRVRFENVSFAYERGVPVLKNIDLDVPAGQTVAVVGPTGAGKTTIAGLIARFYDPLEGRVLVDDQDVRSFEQRSYRAKMGLVTQDPFLFSGTIMENIRYGRIDASDEEVIAAARAANADDFITRLPEGYQTEAGERGKLLSQGQRQLIAIARAILADPRILIMDEATASIDTRTEALIQKALRSLLKGRTSFVIAHRLSTIRNADQLLVIDQNQILERGTHQELLEKGGLYADLYNRQFYNPEKEVVNESALFAD